MLFDDNCLTDKQAANLNVLTLAYVGDAVWSLYARQCLTVGHDRKSGDLHRLASSFVNATAQAQLADVVVDTLTPQEHDVFLRGRNANAHHKAKNQTLASYRKATAMEALVGYLYLSGQNERLKQLLAMQHIGE